MELVKDSTKYLQDSSLVKIDVSYRTVAVGEERGINSFINLKLRMNVLRIFRVAVCIMADLEMGR
jgi:hypothetical protein